MLEAYWVGSGQGRFWQAVAENEGLASLGARRPAKAASLCSYREGVKDNSRKQKNKNECNLYLPTLAYLWHCC